jgi:aryl-alcohol dehydrogenase-like predicted oxidoreductase
MTDRIFSPRRTLGKTGFKATLLGIGDVADRKVPLAECVATVRRAMDAGLNVIDTAPRYEDGYSEEILCNALKGRRKEMFVIDKVDFFDQPVAPQVDGSLARLGIDGADAFIFHGVSKLSDWDKLTAPGGGFEQLDACVKAGKARFMGISSHHPDVLRAALKAGCCGVLMFPIGAFVDERYVTEILPLAKKQKVGTVCIKTFGAGKLLSDTTGYNQPLKERPRGKVSSGGGDPAEPALPHMTVSDCLHYTLTCDPDVALLGLSFPNEQDAALAAARNFKPLSAEQMKAIRRRAAEAIKGKGGCWWNPVD